MHELLLYAQVPPPRHALVLQVLSGISGMKPRHVVERHLLFAPKRADLAAVKAAAQKVDRPDIKQLLAQLHNELYILQVVGEIPRESFPTSADAGKAAVDQAADDAPLDYQFDKLSWSLRFLDLPEVAGRRPVTTRQVASIGTDSSIFEVLKELKHDFQGEYLVDCERVIHNNTVLSMNRILKVPKKLENGKVQLQKELPKLDLCPLLDQSGTYLLQASVRVLDASKPEIVNIGVKELTQLKDTLKGIVELKLGDRLALDTRVKQ